MKKIILLLITALTLSYGYAQIGIGTTSVDPSAILELDNANRALLLPRVANTTAITNPMDGMLIYDISVACVKGYENGAWTSCPSVSTLDCAGASMAGTLLAGTAASSVSFDVDYTVGNGEAYTGETVNSTGVTGLTATLAAGTLATGAGTVTYNVSGTPATSGTASFAITLGGQSCTVNLTVAAPGLCLSPGTITVIDAFTTQSMGTGSVTSTAQNGAGLYTGAGHTSPGGCSIPSSALVSGGEGDLQITFVGGTFTGTVRVYLAAMSTFLPSYQETLDVIDNTNATNLTPSIITSCNITSSGTTITSTVNDGGGTVEYTVSNTSSITLDFAGGGGGTAFYVELVCP